jgi:hypothetical protein
MMANTTFLYSLDMLPVSGMTNIAQTVGEMRQRFAISLMIVDELRQANYGYSAGVRQELENVRYHIVSALSLIDASYRQGINQKQPYADVVDLDSVVHNHIVSVQKAMPVWDGWLTQALRDRKKEDPELPPLRQPEAPVIPPIQETGTTMNKPKDVSFYIRLGLVSAGVMAVYRYFIKR